MLALVCEDMRAVVAPLRYGVLVHRRDFPVSYANAAIGSCELVC